MLNNHDLFSQGGLRHGADISAVLQHHERKVLNGIRDISNIEELTDEFLSKLVEESIVSPITLKTDTITRTSRTEYFAAGDLPCNRGWWRDEYSVEKFPKTVATISIPFSGDPELLKHCPRTFNTCPPFGDVIGNSIKFDIILWGESEIGSEAKAIKTIQDNQKQIEWYVEKVNEEVKEFNSRLPEKVISVFKSKFERLAQENAALDAIGIVEEKPKETNWTPTTPLRKKRRPASVIIQTVENMYVQQLIQTNNNAGDVKNEIQSNE
jgi:hypothetical protein